MSYHVFYNPNPKGRKYTGDCSVRALCGATGMTWDEAYIELMNFGLKEKDMPNMCSCYTKYLEKSGKFRKIVIKITRGEPRLTVKKFCELNPRGTFIVTPANHFQCIKDGKYYDLAPGWESKSIYKCWEKI